MIFGDFIYQNPIESIVAYTELDFFQALKKLEILREKGFLVGYIRYEAWQILHRNFLKYTQIPHHSHHFQNLNSSSKTPLLYFEFFSSRQPFKMTKDNSPNLFFPHFTKTQNFSTYRTRIQKIKAMIRQGNTYQTNYTYETQFSTHAMPEDMFREILERQNTPFKAFFKTPTETILCFSPELFFKIKGDKITTQPMKGTIKRHKDPQKDEGQIKRLREDQKNQSENVMIVDLLRNDLSQICKEIKVESLFEIITLPSLHQMVSTISGVLYKNITLEKILYSLFPCGSVTGAPKLKTLDLIWQIENYQRGIYCGMIGMLDKNNMEFCVPIRTLTQSINQSKIWSLCVGSGITWDSNTQDEFQESLLKTNFIKPKKNFKIIETMRVEKGKIQLYSLHQKRLKNSLKYFGFPKIDFFQLKKTLQAIANDQETSSSLRITLNHTGKINYSCSPILPHTTTKIILSSCPINPHNDFLYHKTTYAHWYKKARKKIKQNQIFDEIFYDTSGILTEGARSNIVLKINNQLLTPKNYGNLNGIMRQNLIDKRIIKEAILTLQDLILADQIFCINAIRGMVEVKLDLKSLIFAKNFLPLCKKGSHYETKNSYD